MDLGNTGQCDAGSRSGLRKDSGDGEYGGRDRGAEADTEGSGNTNEESDTDTVSESNTNANKETCGNTESYCDTNTNEESCCNTDADCQDDNDSESCGDTGACKAGDTRPDQDACGSARCAYAYVGRKHEDGHGQGSVG